MSTSKEHPSPFSSSDYNLDPPILDQINSALSRDYLKIIDGAACCHDHTAEQESSANSGSILFNAGLESDGAVRSSRETAEKVDQITTKYCRNGLCVSENGLCKKRPVVTECPPPDIVLEASPVTCAVNRTYFLKLQYEEEDEGAHEREVDGREMVKRGHLRMWQKNVDCLETEV